MRKVGEEKQPEIDLQRKITVEITLQEILIAKAAMGTTSDCEVGSHLNKFYEQLGGESLIPNVDGMDVYDDLTALLENEGVKEDD
ncbi:hypothetical protein [Oceanobacillus neutriphilus]|uniref:Uncharacterized protein n=1 Tax=Oceanobacillus neutriphilus TaxID=531815 RepID=A0ABQ2NY45_9BACI|nr:hypothetical protein [Oceanobacillus neutriphilus]GGP13500.1 hypothetical protein GCM10011346_33740 [Oceanobacillus neutriphilus]